AARINQLLLARIERMALGANFNADVLLRGTRVNHIAACAGNGRFLIVRMNIFHICHLFRLISAVIKLTLKHSANNVSTKPRKLQGLFEKTFYSPASLSSRMRSIRSGFSRK